MEIDKDKLKISLLDIKNEVQDEKYHYDYITIDIKKSEAYGENYDYEYSYNQWGDEVDKWIVDIRDKDTKYIFDDSILYDIEKFIIKIEQLIEYRIRANNVFDSLLSYAQDIVDEYEYEHKYYAQIAWNIKDRKIFKRSFGNECVYEEHKIEDKPSDGIFTLNVDEFIEEKCSFDNEGYEHLDGYYTNGNKIRSFVFGTIASYYNYEDFGLYYPEELLDSSFEFTSIQDLENQEETMENNTETTVKEALNGNKCSVMKSLTNTYEGTDIPIVYLTLQEEFKGQDYLVMSKSTAQEYLYKCDDDERKEFLSKCNVSYSKEGDCYGITLPRTYVKIAEYQF